MTTNELKIKATELRIDILKMINKANSGHPGGSLSAIDIMTALYYGDTDGKPFMKIDSSKPSFEGQDYFVLSKGHAAPALYAVLADKGFFAKEELDHFRQMNSLLQGHPSRKIPGVTMTTGSLGQGLAAADGLAMSLKMDRQPNRVYCMLGDGELQEGEIWESAMTAAHYKLDNLIAFVDKNELQIDGLVKAIMNVDPVAQKFESFGWKVIQVVNGHDMDEVSGAIKKALKVQRQPICIVANTIKGKGVPFAEGKASYHGTPLSDEEMAEAIPLLKKEIETLKNA
ncbi:MAG: transketolase [Patescibacteria group bacterium]|nr:transketolase [Patescibacteria group bacterium]